jgi:transposase
MSLQREEIGPIPEETARVAKASFPKGNRYMRLRDALGTIFDDDEFTDLFARRGQPAEAPWRVGLVCIRPRHASFTNVGSDDDRKTPLH